MENKKKNKKKFRGELVRAPKSSRSIMIIEADDKERQT